MDYSKQSPAEVDGVLYKAQEAYGNAMMKQAQLQQGLDKWRPQAESHERQIELTGENSMADYYKKQLAKVQGWIDDAEESLPALEKALQEANDIMDDCNAEWVRRGRWSRFYMVTNTNGHLHKTMNPRECSSLFETTRFAFMYELSGQSDAEVVELAGSSACTLCFPDAPVDVLRRASRLEAPERKAAREERERLRAEKQAKTDAKAITNPDGSELVVGNTGYRDKIKTEAEAQRLYLETASTELAIEAGRYEIPNTEYRISKQEANEVILVALAHKRGTSVEEQREFLAKKAAAKYKREWK